MCNATGQFVRNVKNNEIVMLLEYRPPPHVIPSYSSNSQGIAKVLCAEGCIGYVPIKFLKIIRKEKKNNMNIKDIQIGGLYYIPYYVTAMYDFEDPKSNIAALSNGGVLQPGTPVVPLEIHTVDLKQPYGYNVYRIKILTTDGVMGWLSLQEKDLEYIFPVANCDKKTIRNGGDLCVSTKT